jgi:histidinol-phosphate phosphatase family protein
MPRGDIIAPKGAFFFDRDGTLIHDTGYLSDPELVELLPGVRETLVALREAGYLLFLFTNQSGVARGYFGMDAVEAVNARLARLLGGGETFFDGVCIAPEHPDNPPVYRKPCPRFILETISERGQSPSSCFMVGDRTSDLQAGVNAGIRAVRYCGDIDDQAAAEYAREHAIATIRDFRDLLGFCR